MLRILAYLLLLIGCIFIGDAAYDEYRRIAAAISPGRGSSLTIVKRADDPKQFRSLMAYQWFRGPLVLFGGFLILGFCRRADRLDPFSPDASYPDDQDRHA